MPKKKALNKKERDELFEINSKVLIKILKGRSIYLGIDLGTRETGLYKYSKRYTDINSSLLLISNHDNVTHRVFEIMKQMKPYVKKPESVIAIIEDYAFAKNNSSVSQISELGGVVNNILFKKKIPYLKVTPQTLKKFVLGPNRGKAAGKEFIMMEVLDRWKIKFNNNNTCDSYCLCKFLEGVNDFLHKPDNMTKWESQMFRDFVTNRGIPIMRR